MIEIDKPLITTRRKGKPKPMVNPPPKESGTKVPEPISSGVKRNPIKTKGGFTKKKRY